jgi:hypothetical protein
VVREGEQLKIQLRSQFKILSVRPVQRYEERQGGREKEREFGKQEGREGGREGKEGKNEK